jgi:hypothetical protein
LQATFAGYAVGQLEESESGAAILAGVPKESSNTFAIFWLISHIYLT